MYAEAREYIENVGKERGSRRCQGMSTENALRGGRLNRPKGQQSGVKIPALKRKRKGEEGGA